MAGKSWDFIFKTQVIRRAELRQQWALRDTDPGSSPCSVTARGDLLRV